MQQVRGCVFSTSIFTIKPSDDRISGALIISTGPSCSPEVGGRPGAQIRSQFTAGSYCCVFPSPPGIKDHTGEKKGSDLPEHQLLALLSG